MEGPYGNNNPKVSKLKDFKGNVSPINTYRDNNHQFFIGVGHFHHPSKSPTFDPYAAAVDKSNLENLDPSTLIRHLRSGSPVSPDAGNAFKTPAVMIGHQYLSANTNSSGGTGGFGSRVSLSPLTAVENFGTPPLRSPPLFKTPVKVEEDVLVMDGILVGGSVSSGRMRLSASSDSGGSSSSGSNSFYKREICRSWEDSSHCRHGSKCQFAHGKEEIRTSRLASKNKADICKSYSGSGSCSYGANCRFSHHQVITASPTTERSAVKEAKAQSVSPIRPENSDDSTSSGSSKTTSSSCTSSKTTTTTSITVTNTDWSPMDDGIMVSLPSSASVDEIPSREAVDAYIRSVLYGPSRGKRLPVFAEICPE